MVAVGVAGVVLVDRRILALQVEDSHRSVHAADDENILQVAYVVQVQSLGHLVGMRHFGA